MSLEKFHRLCLENALSWKIEFTEGDGMYEIHAWGIGKGEDFYVKKTSHLEMGLARRSPR